MSESQNSTPKVEPTEHEQIIALLHSAKLQNEFEFDKVKQMLTSLIEGPNAKKEQSYNDTMKTIVEGFQKQMAGIFPQSPHQTKEYYDLLLECEQLRNQNIQLHNLLVNVGLNPNYLSNYGLQPGGVPGYRGQPPYVTSGLAQQPFHGFPWPDPSAPRDQMFSQPAFGNLFRGGASAEVQAKMVEILKECRFINGFILDTLRNPNWVNASLQKANVLKFNTLTRAVDILESLGHKNDAIQCMANAATKEACILVKDQPLQVDLEWVHNPENTGHDLVAYFILFSNNFDPNTGNASQLTATERSYSLMRGLQKDFRITDEAMNEFCLVNTIALPKKDFYFKGMNFSEVSVVKCKVYK